jgi:pimeloyl-ACP methyl ester carboxylesterase
MNPSVNYAKMFCSVLSEPSIAAERWNPCDTYVDMPSATPPATLDGLSTKWTLLLIGGFGAQCFVPKDIIAFRDAAEHLKDKHQVDWHLLQVDGFGSSEDNATQIKDQVGQLKEPRFIVIAHSKGAADTLVALTTYPKELTRIDAVITVAGAIGGSWIVDDFAGLNERVLRRLELPCQAPLRAQNGIDSMKRENRQKYLARVEHHWPAYSISAVSEKDNTSVALMPLWKRLQPYAKEQDSHIVEREAMVPGGVFLARALGDHWAVAMPFYGNPKVKESALRIVNHNRFPRTALIEAAVRQVTQDLERKTTP